MHIVAGSYGQVFEVRLKSVRQVPAPLHTGVVATRSSQSQDTYVYLVFMSQCIQASSQTLTVQSVDTSRVHCLATNIS